MKQIAIQMKAEAAVKFEMIPYTGTRGLYASMVPQSPDRIVDLAKKLGITLDSNVVHTTVCYSKQDAVPLGSLPNYGSSDEFPALCNEVTHWVGHKGQTCVVLKIISPDIVRLNAQLQAAGAKHTFTPYAPHITLSDDFGDITDETQKMIDAVNQELALNPIQLVFDRYQVGDQDN